MNKKENYLRAIKRNYPQWIPYENEAVVTITNIPTVERPAQKGKDCFGCEWDYNALAEGGTYPSEKNFVITDITKWKEQLSIPSIESLDWSPVEEASRQIDRSEYLIQGFCEMGLFERSYLLMGMENALVAYYTNPEEMYELCGAIADYKIRVIKKFHEAAHLDMMWYGDDWGTQQNLFMSPDIWRQIIKPHTQRIYNCMKELGILINQHSCGKIELIFGDICEMGADMWNPCQPCNNLRKLKQKYGDKISFYGGVDSQFILDNDQATTEDVKNEVIKRIGEMSDPSGGYIIAPSHTVPFDPEKTDAMIHTVMKYRNLK